MCICSAHENHAKKESEQRTETFISTKKQMSDCDMCNVSVFLFSRYSILAPFSTVFCFFYQPNLQSTASSACKHISCQKQKVAD